MRKIAKALLRTRLWLSCHVTPTPGGLTSMHPTSLRRTARLRAGRSRRSSRAGLDGGFFASSALFRRPVGRELRRARVGDGVPQDWKDSDGKLVGW